MNAQPGPRAAVPWDLTIKRLEWPAGPEYFLVGLAMGLCSAIATVGLSVQWIPYGPMQSVVASGIPAGFADRFTMAAYESLIGLVRAVTGFCALAAVASFFWRRRIVGILCNVRSVAARDLAHGVRQLALLIDERPYTLALLGVTVACAVLRGFFLLTELPHNDEAYTFTQYASRPPFVGLMYYTANNHVLNTLSIHLSTALFGASIWAVRLPAFASGVLIIPALYAAVRVNGNRDSAILAASLAGISMPLIEYSANGRGYSMGTLFLLAMVIAGASNRNTWRWLSGLAGALAVFSVPTMLYGVAAVIVWRWLRRRDHIHALTTGCSFGAFAAILYTPAIAFSGIRAIAANKFTEPLTWSQWRDALWNHTIPAMQPWTYWTAGLPVALGVLLAAAAIAGMFRRWQLYTVAVAVAAAMITIQRVSPPTRVWLFLAPLMIWCASDVLAALARKFSLHRFVPYAALAIGVAGAPFAATSKATPATRADSLVFAGAEQAARFIVEHYPEGGRIRCCSPWDNTVKYYLARQGYAQRTDGPELVIAGVNAPPDERELSAPLPLRPVPFCCSARLYVVDGPSRQVAKAPPVLAAGVVTAAPR